MMRWPWSRCRDVETRGHTDVIVDALLSAATGADSATVLRTAALEAYAGWWGRCLATADVTRVTPATAALIPEVLRAIGRGLCRYREALHVIDVNGAARGRLTEAGQWHVEGGAARETLRYRAHLCGPSFGRCHHPGGAPASCTVATRVTACGRGRASARWATRPTPAASRGTLTTPWPMRPAALAAP